MTAQTLDLADTSLERPKSEWTTPVLEVARMAAATRGIGGGLIPGDGDTTNDHDDDGIHDDCDEDVPGFEPDPFGSCEDLGLPLS